MAYRKLDVLDVMYLNNGNWHSLENTNGEVHLPFKNIVTGTTGNGYKSLQIEVNDENNVGNLFLNGSDVALNGGNNALNFSDDGITLSFDQDISEYGFLQIGSKYAVLAFSDYGGMPQNKIDLSNSGITISVANRDDASIKINGKTNVDSLSSVTLYVSSGLSATALSARTCFVKDNVFISGQTTTSFLSANTVFVKDNVYISGQTVIDKISANTSEVLSSKTDSLSAKTINITTATAGIAATCVVDNQGQFDMSVLSGRTALNGLTVNSSGATLQQGTLTAPSLYIQSIGSIGALNLRGTLNSDDELNIGINSEETSVQRILVNKDGLKVTNGDLFINNISGLSTGVSINTVNGNNNSNLLVAHNKLEYKYGIGNTNNQTFTVNANGGSLSFGTFTSPNISGTTFAGSTLSGTTVVGSTISGSSISAGVSLNTQNIHSQNSLNIAIDENEMGLNSLIIDKDGATLSEGNFITNGLVAGSISATSINGINGSVTINGIRGNGGEGSVIMYGKYGVNNTTVQVSDEFSVTINNSATTTQTIHLSNDGLSVYSGVLQAPTISGNTLVGPTISGTNISASTGVYGNTVKGATISGNTIKSSTAIYSPTISGTTVVGPTISGSNISATWLSTNNIESEEELNISINQGQTGLNALRINKDGVSISKGTLVSPTVSASTVVGPTLSGTNIQTAYLTSTDNGISGITQNKPIIFKSNGGIIKSQNITTGRDCYHEIINDDTNHAQYKIFTSTSDNGYTRFTCSAGVKGYWAETYVVNPEAPNTNNRIYVDYWHTESPKKFNAPAFDSSSDERLKNFGKDIEVDFEKIKSIPKKYFTWKTKEEANLPESSRYTQYTLDTEIGTSAQELRKVFPELVSESPEEDKILSVDYSKLSIIALAAIDKLYDKINEQQKLIDELMKK